MSLATTVPRKTAPRAAKPAVRYWKGKAPKGVAEVQSDSDEDEEAEEQEQEDEMIGGSDEDEDMVLRKDVGKGKATMNIALKDVAVSREGKVIVAGREESGRTALEEEEQDEEEEEEEDEEEDEEESSSEESESEEEEKPKLQFRPVFVPKRARATIAEREQLAEDTEEALRKKEEEAEERRKQSHNMVAESIRRELAEKEKEDDVPDVDDTDGLDPEGEFEAWRLRELARIKKEKEDEVAREKEREEVERRRAMPEEQRMKEDMENAKRLRDEKPKGQQKFLQKYYHKGAFHQDLDILKKHDYTEATQSAVDVSMLPKVMQVKDFGKRSRTKYTHLMDQDTTATTGGFGGMGSLKSGGVGPDGSGCFNCGGPHLKKDCPQIKDQLTGANARPVGERQNGWPDRSTQGSSWRRDDGHDNGPRDSRAQGRGYDRYDRGQEQRGSYDGRAGGYEDRRRDERSSRHSDSHRRRDRSRSRSPYRPRDRQSSYPEKRQHSRPRSRSRDRSRERERDKRRRVD